MDEKTQTQKSRQALLAFGTSFMIVSSVLVERFNVAEDCR